MEEPLRPWEERAIMEAREGRFTAYVELVFSYLVLDNPRYRPFSRAFKRLMQDKEMGRALMEYCRKKVMGGVCVSAHAFLECSAHVRSKLRLKVPGRRAWPDQNASLSASQG